ncbi:MAG: hydantoinase/oxoprolinase family protein [Anaerolineales bacterium]|nr:MAG: hydantoinase/oxoprolinase family protein [Anaerolineales bacterium]
MTKYRVSADIGGTFTDFVVAEEDTGEVFTGKVPSTPKNAALAVIDGLKDLIPNPPDIGFMVHGTTVGLNTFLERKGARVLLITTAGLRDSYSIARGDRKELYALQYRKPERLVPRRDVHEVRERLKWDGTILEALHEEDLEPIIKKVKDEDIKAVAVCFIHSYAYPQHELRAREILSEVLPDVSITLSHEIAREWREYERASSAVMNAYIAPVVERYLVSLGEQMRGMGVEATLHVMQSSGGIMTVEAARRQPVYILLSGPVGGTIGGMALSKAMHRPNLLCVDMGGTSFDMSLIVNGQPNITSETELEGLPMLMSIVDIHTIGAGGGSLAWLEAGALRVGPQSAGADPGPVCYDRGGTQPTVTDANLFLKRLGAQTLLSGRMMLNEEATAKAIHTMAPQVGLDDVAFAEGMLSIINAKMADAMRTITVEQGIDPREYSLVAFGGAGPMHAVWLAEELEIGEVIVPWTPGTFSAWGMLQTDMRHDLTLNFYHPLAGMDSKEIEGIYEQLKEEGVAALKEEGVPPEDMYFERSTDMRYVGQEYSVNVRVGDKVDLEEIDASFHNMHAARYGHSTPSAPVEFVNLRLAALGHLVESDGRFEIPKEDGDPVTETREAVFDGKAYKTPVLWRYRVEKESKFSGPLIIEEESATTIVPPGYQARVDDLGNILITVEQA